MRLHFYGVRGSTPAPGPEFVRYGGHTSCVGVSADGESPRLVLDAGTGLQRLARALGGEPFRGTVLLGHLHWDHTHGIPFFRAGDRTDAVVRVFGPVPPGEPSLERVLERMMSPPHFPIHPAGLRGDWSFRAIEPGEHTVEGFTVTAREIPHKGGRTLGYRVSDGASSIAYLSDHCPTATGPGPDGLGARHEAALELADGADVLVHDAQYTAAELPDRASFGHAAGEYAVALGREAGVAHVVLFHHDPARTDDEVDEIAAGLQGAGLCVTAAAEGLVVDTAQEVTGAAR